MASRFLNTITTFEYSTFEETSVTCRKSSRLAVVSKFAEREFTSATGKRSPFDSLAALRFGFAKLLRKVDLNLQLAFCLSSLFQHFSKSQTQHYLL